MDMKDDRLDAFAKALGEAGASLSRLLVVTRN
jgi:hypothetical protein